MTKHPRPEVMHKQVAAACQGKTSLANFGAEDIGVEKAHVGPFLHVHQADAVQGFAF